jgi:hypothetical protein
VACRCGQMSALSEMELYITVLTTADGVDDTERDDQMPCLRLQRRIPSINKVGITYRNFSYLGDKGAADEPCCAGDQTEDQEVFSTVGKGLE